MKKIKTITNFWLKSCKTFS